MFHDGKNKQLRKALYKRRVSDCSPATASNIKPKPSSNSSSDNYSTVVGTSRNSSSNSNNFNNNPLLIFLDQQTSSTAASFCLQTLFDHHHRTPILFSPYWREKNEDLVYSQFMKAHKCYDVKKAFYALVYNGVRAAPLWDSDLQQFVGMLTITDFINILQRYHKTGVSHIKELEEHKIATWREVLMKDDKLQPVVSIDPNASLYKAVETLLEHKIHRLPVTNPTTDNILYILTHKRLLRFLYLYIYDLPRPSFLKQTPKELGIGTWGVISTVHQDTPLADAFAKFLEYRVSALPVVDEVGKVVDIYAKFDVINLAADNSYNNLEITVQEALKHRSDWFEGVHSCKESDSLSVVIETLVKAEVHRLVVTDDEKRVRGIVSLSDILSFLVLRPNLQDGQKTNDE